MTLATTLTTLSSASEYSAALPVIHQAPAFIASTTMPTAMLPDAIRCILVKWDIPVAAALLGYFRSRRHCPIEHVRFEPSFETDRCSSDVGWSVSGASFSTSTL